jgi:hypothetical protein
MSGEKVKIFLFKKNYRFIAPNGDVINVRLGYFALLEPFEARHKCSGESKAVKQALTAFVVHLCEAGRLQSVLKDVCEISLDNAIESLDSRCPNSFCINEYGDLGGQEIYMQVGWALTQARWASPPHKPARRLNLIQRSDAAYAG